jgi:hypothetical protein
LQRLRLGGSANSFFSFFFSLSLDSCWKPGNKIGSDGAKSLAEALKVNTTVQRLNITSKSFIFFFVLFFTTKSSRMLASHRQRD